jgi:hypothetical protein
VGLRAGLEGAEEQTVRTVPYLAMITVTVRTVPYFAMITVTVRTLP